MIARLAGKLIHKSPEYLIVDVNGVGYQLFVPLSTFYDLPDTSVNVSFDTYLHVREDALVLYGFSSVDEKNVFLKLISISGIGPKLALGILSGISINDLVDAVEVHDVVKLSTIPGVGKKTAQRLALELKDKLRGITAASEAKASGKSDEEVKMYDDVISALINLGYKKNAAESALRVALKGAKEKSLEKLLKKSLNILSRT